MLTDIYKNRPDFKPSQVYKSFRKDLLEAIEENKLLNVESMSTEELEGLVSKLRENPSRAFTEIEAKQINKKLESVTQEARSTLEDIKLLKERLHLRIKSDSNAYVLDISKSSILQKFSNNVFGGNKKSITYDDYITLLELKKQLEIDEAFSLVED
jgi:uncharacterized protein (UPF0335 family)